MPASINIVHGTPLLVEQKCQSASKWLGLQSSITAFNATVLNCNRDRGGRKGWERRGEGGGCQSVKKYQLHVVFTLKETHTHTDTRWNAHCNKDMEKCSAFFGVHFKCFNEIVIMFVHLYV